MRAERPGGGLWGPALATALVAASFIAGYVAILRFDVSCLVCADPTKIGKEPFEAVRVGFPPDGYDGQFYYAIAQNPWQKATDSIDLPACRHSRIAYIALARALSGGDPKLLLYVLPILNWLALIGLGAVGAALAKHYGRTPWWGVLLPVCINGIAPALRDLTDPTATFFAVTLLAGWLLNWRSYMLLPLGILALLAREQNLAVVAVVLFESLRKRRFGPASYAALSVIVWMAWVDALRQIYGEWPFLRSNLGLPFAGLRYRVAHMNAPLGQPGSWFHAVGVLLLATQFGAYAAMLLRGAERVSLLVASTGLALAVLGDVPIYGGLESYTRVFWCLPLGIWLWAMQSGRRWPALLMALALLWPCYSLLQVFLKVQKGAIVFL